MGTKLQVEKVKMVTCFTTADYVVEFIIVLRKKKFSRLGNTVLAVPRIVSLPVNVVSYACI